MNPEVEIDGVDVKILMALIRDARTSLKWNSKNCGISSPAILKRIKRLKESGLIIGTTVFPRVPQAFVPRQATTIGINVDYSQQTKIVELIQNMGVVVEVSLSTGKYDLSAIVFTKDIAELNDILQAIKRQPGVKRVVANNWVHDPLFLLENIDLQPKKV